MRDSSHPRPIAHRRALTVIAALALSLSTLHAQDIAGIWQGILKAPQGTTKDQRIVINIKRTAAGAWQGMAYNLDTYMPYEGHATTSMTLEGAQLRFAIAPIGITYQGDLAASGASFTGTLTLNGAATPLTLLRVPADAAWQIPTPNAAMAATADPDWDVISIKARDPNDPSGNQSMSMKGTQLVIENRSVEGMLLFAYGGHKKQLIGIPGWAQTERWDIRGVPDVPGSPSMKQAQALIRKLLEERFGLKLHKETRELAVYAVTVAKGGEKMTASAGDPNGTPDENERSNGGQVTMRMTNMSMAEFAPDLGYFLDRPAVNQTALAGRYDFQMVWTADESHAPTDGSAPPGIFTAIQEQLGLKLEPVKAPIDVLVIDTVTQPTAN